ncbi:MAG: glycerol kinase GlpK [Planctomycetes bacterium]|nr:glycerol kinase GlpK [Planctomycetota bacterium]
MGKTVLALDLGTTGNRAIAFDASFRPVAQAYAEFAQHFPRPGWVEHDPFEIWDSLLTCIRLVTRQVDVANIAAVAVTNQRETAVLWDRETGRPVHNAIVWQCRRTAERCAELKARHADEVHRKTGLVIDAYFSATKIAWMLEDVPEARALAEQGRLLFGTVDTWAIWNLTGGRVHATDPSNASRTLLYNIVEGQWDECLVALFGAKGVRLPEVKPSLSVFGTTQREILGREVPIATDLGDQQAALFGQGGFSPQNLKNTYGTGLFLLVNTGTRLALSDQLLTTVAWQKEGQPLQYALEGSVFVGGAAIQWLRDALKLIASASESEAMAQSLHDNEGVYFVPALVGLGAPHWDSTARGTFLGLTRSTRREHLVRAALEAMAYQTRDVVEALPLEVRGELRVLQADGGATANDWLMQFQADILGLPVERSAVAETTALGAAAAAGIAVGLWDEAGFLSRRAVDRVFAPAMPRAKADALHARWREAISRARAWA